MKHQVEKVWKLVELPKLKSGDILAFRAEGWQRPQVAIIGAVTYHWAMAGERLVDDNVSVGDYSVFDSTSKGITAHLLSEYQYRHMRVYRLRMDPPELLDALKLSILKCYYYYGDQKYDVKGVIMVALWCLLRKLGFKVEWWVHDSKKFWCLEFVEIVWRDMGFPLIPADEPAYPTNMERSEKLELIWSSFGLFI